MLRSHTVIEKLIKWLEPDAWRLSCSDSSLLVRHLCRHDMDVGESPHPYPYMDQYPRILKIRSGRIRPLDPHPYQTPAPESMQLSLEVPKDLIC
ncbi:hypothetical protein H5410_005006 [Solanum commersonii]|uniref:Uncharacterized protein n=1 Tax=Solanum commersonii TaxID=4109 RepID=A0A9J6A6F1_SOLCO|nr:hypothetical protein H5410_005006 [Solanum commersonii]